MKMEELRTQLLNRALSVTIGLVLIAVFLGYTKLYLGIILGFILAFGNFMLMNREVEKSLKLDAAKAKRFYWFHSFLRFLVIGLTLVALFKWKAETALGVSIGLLSIVLAAVSTVIIPLKPVPEEKEDAKRV